MNEHPDKPLSQARPSREERLAAKLRENLRRRKDQARSLGSVRDGNSPELPKPPASG